MIVWFYVTTKRNNQIKTFGLHILSCWKQQMKKKKNTSNGLSMVEKPDITSKILHKLNPLDPIRDPAKGKTMTSC